MQAKTLLLLPHPRHVESKDGSFTGDPLQGLQEILDQTIPEQGYHLTIAPDGVTLRHSSPVGAHYGRLTLGQLVQQFGDTLPALVIEDAPDFSRRGVMLDCSRDRVQRMETLYALIDKLAAWKINELQLYMEHTFAYTGHEEVWKDASPFTAEEIRALDDYCKERYIDLVPCQSCLGHMERWLKHPHYRDLAEKPEGFVAPWDPMNDLRPPATLDPSDPRSFELVASLFDELVPNFSSEFVNICDDEPFELGMGKNAARVAELGGRVYLEYLLKLYKHVAAKGKRVQFWADIITQHPDLVPELPKDIIPLVWGYEDTEPSETQCQMVSASGLPFYVCPGTSSWNTVAGRTDNALGNLRRAAERGLKYHAVGYLNTDWGDNGHWQALPVSYLGFVYGAGVSWCYATNVNLDVPAVLNRFAFDDLANEMGHVAYDLGNIYKLIPLPQHNSQWLFHMLQNSDERNVERYEKYADPSKPLPLHVVGGLMEQIEVILSRIERAKLRDPQEDALIKEEFNVASELLLHGAKRLMRQFGEAPETEAELYAELSALVARQRALWLARSRPGGLSDSLKWFEAALASYGQ